MVGAGGTIEIADMTVKSTAMVGAAGIGRLGGSLRYSLPTIGAQACTTRLAQALLWRSDARVREFQICCFTDRSSKLLIVESIGSRHFRVMCEITPHVKASSQV